ncbi:MAG: Enterochelin esterase [Flaviaesturariibacter sp.]|nr:Enterochelin esterase [Flaviaesturariibacter sp.]
MGSTELSAIIVEQKLIYATVLRRYVTVDFYLPKNVPRPSELSLLLINDGQDLPRMPFDTLLNGLIESGQIAPLVCVGVHAGKKRMSEYGTARYPDFLDRGSLAEAYTRFIIDKLIPHIHVEYGIESFRQKAFAGFSLGGLSALDITWNHPSVFSVAGVFSGSLWWRLRDLNDGYDEETDRIMHRQVRERKFIAGQRFYFTTGSLDETSDRNGNGIIDSIDDTTDLVTALKEKGYKEKDVFYTNFEDGRHDVATWARAMPAFLLWGWGVRPKQRLLI